VAEDDNAKRYMADYYVLIKKAVGHLDPLQPGDPRRALYERARTAQLKQLRAILPALSEQEISCEQMALEEAVRQVEAEVACLPGDIALPGVGDLMLAADNIGRPMPRVEARSPVMSAMRPIARSSAIAIGEMPRPMMKIQGAATGRLIRYWRWNSHPRRRPSAGLVERR
jgi:hypothetical protein